MKLEPVLEYCECGCHSLVPYCPVCKNDDTCKSFVQLSNSDNQKFCESCGTEFDWANLRQIDSYYNDWRKVDKDSDCLNNNFESLTEWEIEDMRTNFECNS